jgi:hypothetical protein
MTSNGGLSIAITLLCFFLGALAVEMFSEWLNRRDRAKKKIEIAAQIKAQLAAEKAVMREIEEAYEKKHREITELGERLASEINANRKPEPLPVKVEILPGDSISINGIPSGECQPGTIEAKVAANWFKGEAINDGFGGVSFIITDKRGLT